MALAIRIIFQAKKNNNGPTILPPKAREAPKAPKIGLKVNQNAGIDVDPNQVAYLWKAGAKMAAFAAIMLIAACVVGFAASEVR